MPKSWRASWSKCSTPRHLGPHPAYTDNMFCLCSLVVPKHKTMWTRNGYVSKYGTPPQKKSCLLVSLQPRKALTPKVRFADLVFLRKSKGKPKPTFKLGIPITHTHASVTSAPTKAQSRRALFWKSRAFSDIINHLRELLKDHGFPKLGRRCHPKSPFTTAASG